MPQNTFCYDCNSLDLGNVVKRLGELSRPLKSLERHTDVFADMSLVVAEVGRKFREPPQNNCPLCALLYETRYKIYPDKRKAHAEHPGGDRLYAFPFFSLPPWPRIPDFNPAEAIILLVVPPVVPMSEFTSQLRGKKGYLVVRLNGNHSILAQVPKIMSTTFAHETILECIQECKLNHPRCTKQRPEPIPLSLIDCYTQRIRAADSSYSYCALSYVWGGVPAGRLGPDGQLPSDLAQTIVDAIEVTKKLGYQYLWVDQFCVDQENDVLKKTQLANMAAVYSEADLTLVAASGYSANSGLPGAPLRPRKISPPLFLNGCAIFYLPGDNTYAVSTSKWATRGWTYQEGFLSRRLLFFDDSQTSYQCGETYYSESLGKWLWRSNGEWVYSHQFPKPLGAPGSCFMTSKWSKIDGTDNPEYGIREYGEALGEFQTRRLTSGQDTLFAFAGIVEYAQTIWTSALLTRTEGKGRQFRAQPKVGFIQGIPHLVQPKKTFGVPSHNLLVEGLSWHIGGGQYMDDYPWRRDDFPSWSWAGWIGMARFGHLDKGDPVLIRNVFLEQVDMKQPTLDSQPSKKTGRLPAFDKITSLILPSQKATWRVPIDHSEQLPEANILVFDAYRLPTAAIKGTVDPSGFVSVEIFGLPTEMHMQDLTKNPNYKLSKDFFEKLLSGDHIMLVLAAPTKMLGTYGVFLVVQATGDGYYERLGVAETLTAKEPKEYPISLLEDIECNYTRLWRGDADTRAFVDGIRTMCQSKITTWRLK